DPIGVFATFRGLRQRQIQLLPKVRGLLCQFVKAALARLRSQPRLPLLAWSIQPVIRIEKKTAPVKQPSTNAASDESISRPQQRILDTLATFESLGINSHVAVFSNASPTSGSFAN